ncbi:MAG: phosphoribosylaminoimidazolesuccinocarboxamide synthase [Phycisphaerae bacterium]
MNAVETVRQLELPGCIARGKVRELYDLGERLMIVATDRVSAFDVVMRDPIPGKGVLLTGMSLFWLETLHACCPHHLDYAVTRDHCPPQYASHAAQLAGRAMVVRRARVLPIECVARGYLVGGGWKEYQSGRRVSGVSLPAGLTLASRLPTPIFTPSTKAAAGHDEPIDFERACDLAAAALPGGRELMHQARDRTLQIYAEAAAHAERRGIILADTKFEFGLCDGELILVDEVLTPDSSRFWPREHWTPGLNPPSFDKQYLRDYLETLDWDKRSAPPVPPEVIEQTRRRYEQAYSVLTAAGEGVVGRGRGASRLGE